MADIELTEQEQQTLLRCLNERVEPPEELARKLFPKLYAGFDFKTLNSASIPTIEYAGKRSEAAILNEASAFGAGSPLQLVRHFHGGKLNKQAQQMELFKESGADHIRQHYIFTLLRPAGYPGWFSRLKNGLIVTNG